LPLGFKAGDDLSGVHARLDNLQRYRSVNGFALLGHEHHAHAAFTDLLQEPERADDRARAFGNGSIDGLSEPWARRLEPRAGGVVTLEERIDATAQGFVVATSLGHEFAPPLGLAFQGGGKDSLLVHGDTPSH
jgi:hypothetical protein